MKTLVIGMLSILFALSAQPALAHEDAEAEALAAELAALHARVQEIAKELDDLHAYVDFLLSQGLFLDPVPAPDPACSMYQLTVPDLQTLLRNFTGCTLVLSGTPVKIAFTEPGRFYSFDYPDAPDDIFAGDFGYGSIAYGNVITGFNLFLTWDPDNNSTEFLWTIALTFTSEFEGTYESTYIDNTVAPPIDDNTTGTFSIISEAAIAYTEPVTAQ